MWFTVTIDVEPTSATTPESTGFSQALAAVDKSDSQVGVDAVERNWGDYREPYCPWTGVKTAAAIAALLTAFVVYLAVRARCTSTRRRQVFLRVLSVVRTLTLSLTRCSKDRRPGGAEAPPRQAVRPESLDQCLQRVELELQVNVVADQDLTDCNCSSDGVPVSEALTTKS